MDRRYYSKRHFQRLADNAPQKDDGLGNERTRAREIRDSIHAAMIAEFGQPNETNAGWWVAEQERRIKAAGI
jgi:hypothetical protein